MVVQDTWQDTHPCSLILQKMSVGVSYDDNNQGMILGEGVVENLSITNVKECYACKRVETRSLKYKTTMW